jgi:hypothetical protein
MPMFANKVQGQSSTMAIPFIQGKQANAIMPLFASDMLGVEQDATLSKSARKLHFNE